MTAFARTWTDDDALLKRTLEKAENEAARLLSVGTVTPFRKCTVDSNEAVALNTTYTNTSDYPMLVVVSVDLVLVAQPTGNSTTRATLRIDPAGANVQRLVEGRTNLAGGNRTFGRVLHGIVNPGETWRLDDTGTTTGGSVANRLARIIYLDGRHPAQTYTVGEQPAVSKLNTLAAAINNGWDADAAVVPTAGGWTVDVSSSAARFLLAIATLRVSNATFLASGRLTDHATFKAPWTGAANPQPSMMVPFIVNAEESILFEEITGTLTIPTQYKFNLPVHAATTFTASGPEPAKWGALDDAGVGCVNPSQGMTRSAFTLAPGTSPTWTVVHATRWTFFSAHATFSPNATTGSPAWVEVRIRDPGVPGTEYLLGITEITGTTQQTTTVDTYCGFVPPGWEVALVSTLNNVTGATGEQWSFDL